MPFFDQVVDRLESDVCEQLCDSRRLLARPRREPRKVPLQAFSGAKCTERRAHDLCHPHVRDEEAP